MKRGSRKVSTKRMQRENGAIDTELLKSQVAILSGGIDLAGNPLVSFPVRSVADGSTQPWDLDGACKYLVYLQDVIYLILKRKSAAFLANFRHGCDEGAIIDVIKALEHLEIERHGAVIMLYVVKPKSRSKTRLLKKLLGLRPPKKDTVNFVSKFKTVIVKTVSELHTQIDLNQLTTDFGGNLVYDHDAWIFLHKKILPTLAQCEDVKDRLYDVKDKALLMADYETIGQTAEFLKTLHAELEDQFNSLLRHSDVELTVEKCKQTLHHLDDSEDESPISNVHPNLLTQIVTQIRNSFTDLSASQIDLEAVWKSVDEGIRKQISLKEKKEEADKLCMEITERYWPLMTQHPNIGTNLSQAELYRTHFKSLLYDPAKEIIADATGILETLQRMNVRESSHQDDIKTIVDRLTNTIHPFATQLNDINQIYVEMHVFFLVYEKALVWYKKALDLIPTSLCSRAANGDSSVLSTPSGWRTSVQTFLRKHPAPRDDHIAHIDVNIPDIVDRTTVMQAQLLADRLRLIISILRSNRLEANLLCHVYDWKIEKMSNTGELLFTEDDHDPLDEGNFFPNAPCRYLPPKRRTGRINMGGRTRFHRREGGSVIEHRPQQHHQMLRRTSSDDTDKHLLIGSENMSFGRSKDRSASEFSINQCTKRIPNSDLDNVVEFIQKLTSSRSMSSDKKLQYVSELILNLDLDDTDHEIQPKISRRRYSPSAKIIRKISRKNSVSDKKPCEEISDLNRRLCRSMDNIFDIDFGSERNNCKKKDQSKSMLHIPNSHYMYRSNMKRENEISVVHETNELSSRESIDSIVDDEGSIRIDKSTEHLLTNRKPPSPSPCQDSLNDQSNEPENLTGNTGSYIIFHKHSRERSIDCTPKNDSTHEQKDEDVEDVEDNEKNVDDQSEENFKRRSVTRIASMYKKRKSWNVPNKSESKDGGHSTRNDYVHITESELTTPDQVNMKKMNSASSASCIPSKNEAFGELDFSSGIFGSAPRKSMSSLSTDLGYDSNQDHTLTDDTLGKDPVCRTTSGGAANGRRHSITCGTSVLRLRRSSSNELDGIKTSHVLHSKGHFKEYKV